MRTLLSITLFSAAISFNSVAGTTPDEPHIYIQGQASINTVPDSVQLNVAIVEVDKNLMVAKQKADQTMAKAIKIAKQTGVDDKKINAAQIQINRDTQYNRETGKQDFNGYRVGRSLTFTLNEVDKYPQLLQNLVDAGINEIKQTQFITSRQIELQKQAQKMAIDDAKKAAKEFADNYDVKIKGLYSASSSPINTGMQPYMRVENAMLKDSPSGSYVPDAYHTGEITITSSSYAIYLIEGK